MEFLTKLRTVGGSIMARIPKEVLEQESLRAGDIVKLKIIKIKTD